jgi:hypothetical protein
VSIKKCRGIDLQVISKWPADLLPVGGLLLRSRNGRGDERNNGILRNNKLNGKLEKEGQYEVKDNNNIKNTRVGIVRGIDRKLRNCLGGTFLWEFLNGNGGKKSNQK